MQRFQTEPGKILLNDNLPPEVLRELAAEQLVDRKRDGRNVRVFESGKRRNEALDCLVSVSYTHLTLPTILLV